MNYEDLCNIPAEQSLLGALLMNEDAMARVEPTLTADCFAHELHAKVFASVLSMIEAGIRPTPITLKNHFAEIENPYLAAMAANSASLIDVGGVSKLICDLYQRRKLNEALKQIIESPPATPISDLSCALSEELHSITTQTSGVKIRSNKEVAMLVYEDMMQDKAPYLTGIRKLDEAMGGGLYAGRAYGFAGRKKMGKTIMAGTLSYNLNASGVKHMFICAEMGSREIHQRMLARYVAKYPSAFRKGNLRPNGFESELALAIRNMPNNIIYCDAPGITFDRLKLAVSTAIVKHGIKGFILDYWQLVGGKSPKENEVYHMGLVAQWMADICKQHDIWVVSTAQINQEGNTRGGEGLRLAFDQVYQIHRHNTDDDNNPNFWLEMMDTRYTAWADVGSEHNAGMVLNEKGIYFEEPTVIM